MWHEITNGEYLNPTREPAQVRCPRCEYMSTVSRILDRGECVSCDTPLKLAIAEEGDG